MILQCDHVINHCDANLMPHLQKYVLIEKKNVIFKWKQHFNTKVSSDSVLAVGNRRVMRGEHKENVTKQSCIGFHQITLSLKKQIQWNLR